MMIPTVGLLAQPTDFSSFSMDRYATSLLDALQGLVDGRLDVQEVRPDPAYAARRLLPGTSLFGHWVRFPHYLLAMRSRHFDVNHVLDHAYGHLIHVLDPTRTIVTCHDLFPILHCLGRIPGLRRRRRPVTVELSIRALRQARFVIAVSESTKRDLVDTVGVDAEAIRVIPMGIDSQFRPVEVDREALAVSLGPPPMKKVLSVDTGVPYKNTAGILRSFAQVRRRMSAEVLLVRVGSPLSEPDGSLAARLGIEDAVVELGQVADSQMPLLYNSCDVLLFPSLYEGFGWPPLEAMACGLPVVTSRAAALQESVGEVAPSADAEDHAGLADRVTSILEDQSAAEGLRSRGLALARRFSWRNTAQMTADLYYTILASGAA